MIQSNELRIGNYVEHISFGIVPIEGIIRDSLKTIYKKNEFWDDFKFHKRIPLTEEWFLKCKSNSIFNNGFEYKKTSTGRFEIYAGTILITVIEFVHELQNLNFALLGEDVIIENY